MSGLRVAVVDPTTGEIAAVCDCGEPIGAAGTVLLPERSDGELRALCGACLAADPEALAAVPERGIDVLEAFLLLLTAKGCSPRSVASAEASS